MLDCWTVRKEYALRVVVISGILLLATLFFAPWYDRGFVLDYEVTRTALEPPQGWLTVLAWLTTLALLIEVVVTRLSTTGLPDVAVPWVRIQLVQAAVVFLCVLLKVAVTKYYAWGAGVGLLLAGTFAYAVWAAAGEPRFADIREWRRN